MWALCKKGTDGYLFDASECVQPELINLLRFTLQVIGDRFPHSPRRSGVGANSVLCCQPAPIKWRWSGAAKWPNFAAGGKETGVHPLHSLEEDHADVTGRLSWRGYPVPYGDVLDYNNFTYPAHEFDASWLTPLEHVGLEGSGSELRRLFETQGDPESCRSYWDSGGRGLHRGDVIQAVHVEEIIAAVNYLLANGLWAQVPVKRRAKNPHGPFIDGLECGEYHGHSSTGSPADVYEILGAPGGPGCKCCWYIDEMGNCIEYPTPDNWDDCWATTTKVGADEEEHGWSHGICQIEEHHTKGCISYDCTGWDRSSEEWWVACGEDPSPGFQCLSCGDNGCGSVQVNGKNHQQPTDYCADQGCSSKNCGWEGFICGPIKCPGGCDSDHGNTAGGKDRNDHDCPQPNRVGMPYRYGNCFDETFSCADVIDGGDSNLGFQTVRAVRWRGACGSWLEECDGACESTYNLGCIHASILPDVAGLPDHFDWLGAYFCSEACIEIEVSPGFWTRAAGASCALEVPNCDWSKQWARIDLNIAGPGYDSAAGMPVLKAYDETPTPGLLEDGGVNLNTEPYSKCLCETADPSSPTCE